MKPMQVRLRLFFPFTDMEVACTSTLTPSTLAGLHILLLRHVKRVFFYFYFLECACAWGRGERGPED